MLHYEEEQNILNVINLRKVILFSVARERMYCTTLFIIQWQETVSLKSSYINHFPEIPALCASDINAS